MKLFSHHPLEGLIDELMLGHSGLAVEGGRAHIGGIVLAIAGEIVDGDLGVGQGFEDEGFDLPGCHRHRIVLHASSANDHCALW